MKLLLRRNQKSGMMGMGSIVFSIDARAELTPPEAENVKKYKMGKTMLYKKFDVEGGRGLLGLASRLAYKMLNIEITIDDLVGGKHVECKDIVEMIAVEEQIREACQNFKAVLDTAAHFGGEQIIEI